MASLTRTPRGIVRTGPCVPSPGSPRDSRTRPGARAPPCDAGPHVPSSRSLVTVLRMQGEWEGQTQGTARAPRPQLTTSPLQVGILLHYSTLATMLWIGVTARNIYKQVTKKALPCPGADHPPYPKQPLLR